ncbi:hypothetical protein BKD30_05375 [Tersicoccus phoenicis]|uniref:N-acetyltransferase domain-containing protein n=1 Tax=Tersicoccus phoenicis TaxID=554083 RepID=A0A1R1LES8_9MICC|nr:GNAT family N-acetyltransferase [Tersicoccus phoenicis]OMH26005.1 hypothetical protein BKD30_05375 [Tersicoccus phoenicis]
MDPAFTPLTTADTPAWADLTTVLARADETEEFYSAEDLAEELAEEGVDPQRDTWAVRDRAGDGIVAFGQVRVRVRAELLHGRAIVLLGGGVHPDWRRRGIGRALMDRMEARARELAAGRHPGAPVTLRNPGGLETDPVRHLLIGRGYTLSRYFVQMERSLPGPTPAPPGPTASSATPPSATPSSAVAGYRIVPFTAALSAGTHRARNAAFADHWGSTSTSEAEWADLIGARSFTADCSFLAVASGSGKAAAGDVHAFCLAQDWQDGQLYLALIGTVPAARGVGLARACIAASLEAAVRRPDTEGRPRFSRASLHVDADSPTGATRLYRAAGFAAVKTFATFTRDLPVRSSRSIPPS